MGSRCSCARPGDCCPEIDDGDDRAAGEFVTSLSVLDWQPGKEPVGHVFEESLEDVGPLDRQLLLFCATSSLAAIRWLVHVGACWDACDANGSTCLHVACRSGSLPVVSEVLSQTSLLDAADIAGWTPLHITAHVGRREATLRLLRAKASPHWRNARGQTPGDLCIDPGTLELLRAFSGYGGLGSEDVVRRDADATEAVRPLQGEEDPDRDIVGVSARCEPECFFVNPVPVLRGTEQHRKALLQVAVVIFNLRPTHGIAFAVVSGLVDSYTASMRILLQNGGVCRARVGSFLGEAFSLCTLIRFSVFDSLPLQQTGVVSALLRVLRILQLPEDLHKIDRIVRSLAHVWWRKHKALAEGLAEGQAAGVQQQHQDGHEHAQLQSREPLQQAKPEMPKQPGRPVEPEDAPSLEPPSRTTSMGPATPRADLAPAAAAPAPAGNAPTAPPPAAPPTPRPKRPAPAGAVGEVEPDQAEQAAAGAPEVSGLELRQYLAGAETLCQLMLSTVLLHWYIHGDGKVARRSLPFDAWATLNKGIEVGGTHVPDIVQRRIHGIVCNSFRQELALAAPKDGTDLARPLSCISSLEGWVQLVGGALPCPEGVSSATWEHTATGLSHGLGLPRTTAGGADAAAGAGGADSGLPAHTSAAASCGRIVQLGGWPPAPCGKDGQALPGVVWASICSLLLCFAVAPGSGPMAAPYAVTDLRHMRIASVDSDTGTITLQGIWRQNATDGPPTPLCFAVLLSDGRWQEAHVQHLELRLASAAVMDLWVSRLVRWQSGSQVDV